MDAEAFKRYLRNKGVLRGDFLAIRTSNSVCTGYFLEAYMKTNAGGFINLSGTRKIGQGRHEEDWYDHTYSVPVSRIKEIAVLDKPFPEFNACDDVQETLKVESDGD